MILQVAIGMRMREIRQQLARTQREIASRAGIDHTFYCQMENGFTNITAKNLSLVIHQGLQVNLATFFETELFAPINITNTERYERDISKTRKRPGQDGLTSLFPIHGTAVPVTDPGISKRSKQSPGKSRVSLSVPAGGKTVRQKTDHG